MTTRLAIAALVAAAACAPFAAQARGYGMHAHFGGHHPSMVQQKMYPTSVFNPPSDSYPTSVLNPPSMSYPTSVLNH
jgi:hypothetical protein